MTHTSVLSRRGGGHHTWSNNQMSSLSLGVSLDSQFTPDQITSLDRKCSTKGIKDLATKDWARYHLSKSDTPDAQLSTRLASKSELNQKAPTQKHAFFSA